MSLSQSQVAPTCKSVQQLSGTRMLPRHLALALGCIICCARDAVAQSAIPAPEGLPHPEAFHELDCCLRAFAAEYGANRVDVAGAGGWVDSDAASAATASSIKTALRLEKCSLAELAACPKPSRVSHPMLHTVRGAGAGGSVRSDSASDHSFARRSFKGRGEAPVGGVVVYVAPNGSDAAAGTESEPLRTLAAAR